MDCFLLGRLSVFTCREESEAGFFVFIKRQVFRVLYQIFLVHLSKWWCGISPLFINRYGYVTGFEQWNMSRDMVYATLFVSSESQCMICHALSLPWLLEILQTPAAPWTWILEWGWWVTEPLPELWQAYNVLEKEKYILDRQQYCVIDIKLSKRLDLNYSHYKKEITI